MSLALKVVHSDLERGMSYAVPTRSAVLTKLPTLDDALVWQNKKQATPPAVALLVSRLYVTVTSVSGGP
jgi:hypothetical protein